MPSADKSLRCSNCHNFAGLAWGDSNRLALGKCLTVRQTRLLIADVWVPFRVQNVGAVDRALDSTKGCCTVRSVEISVAGKREVDRVVNWCIVELAG